MSERFTKTDVQRAFGILSDQMDARGIKIALSIYAPGDGVTRYRVVKRLESGGEQHIIHYAYLGAREAYIGIMNTVRILEEI